MPIELEKALQKACLRKGQDSFRIFHGRGHCFKGLEAICVDYFHPVLLVSVFEAGFDSAIEAEAIKLCRAYLKPLHCSALLIQRRYCHPVGFELLEGSLPSEIYARRGSLRFQLSFRAQNIGFFLDIEPARQWLEARACGQKILNLCAYTCAFSLVARAAAASEIVNIDMSSASLAVGRDNHQLNAQSLQDVRFLAHDMFKSWGKLKKLGPYNTVIVDPPSYQKGSFVATKDYQRVLTKLGDLSAVGGEVLLCLNAPEITASEFEIMIAKGLAGFEFVERLPANPDFPDVDAERALKLLVYRKTSAPA